MNKIKLTSLSLILLVILDATGDAFRAAGMMDLHHVIESFQIAGWIAVWALFDFNLIYIVMYVIGRIWLFDMTFNLWAGNSLLYIGSTSFYGKAIRGFADLVHQNYMHFSFILKFIAGIWWGYEGSTERKVGLCPGGAYQDYSESSYSGNSSDSTGNQTMAWGAAGQNGGAGNWSIQGDYQQGRIFVQYNDGSQITIRYQQCGETGCLLFNGNKLCRAGRCE